MTAVRVAVTMPWAVRVGGAESMMGTFLRHVDRRRLDVRVAFLDRGPFEREVAALGFETATVPAGRLREARRLAGAVGTLAGILRAWQPELVLHWSPKAQLYGSLAVARARLATVGVWWQHDLAARHWVDISATLLPARAVGCSSAHSARAQQGLWPRRPTFVVHPGIELAGRRSTSPARLEIPDGRVVVGMVGRLQPWKGQHHLLDALARLREGGHDVHGLFVGGPALGLAQEYAPALRARAARLGLAERVTFTGPVDDVDPYLRGMDVFVNGSAREPFGISMLEAMAHELPVVAAARGGAAEVVAPGDSGWLVDEIDGAALAAALAPLVLDPTRRTAMGCAGRRRCEERFTATRMTAALQDRLCELIDDR